MNPWNDQNSNKPLGGTGVSSGQSTFGQGDGGLQGGDGLKREARDVASRQSQRVRETAHDLGQSGRQLIGEARERLRSATGDVRERALRFADEQRLRAARECRLVCDSLGRASERFREGSEQTFLAGYIDTASSGIHSIADYFEQREPMEMLDDVRGVARRHPGIVLGGLFALGVAVGRFLTASEDEAYALESQDLSGGLGEIDELGEWSSSAPLPVEPRWPRYEAESNDLSMGSVHTGTPNPSAPLRHGDSPDLGGSLHESSTLRREDTIGRPKNGG